LAVRRGPVVPADVPDLHRHRDPGGGVAPQPEAAVMSVKRPRKAPAGPREYLRRWQLQAWLAVAGIVLYAPLISMMAFSFTNSRRNIVWQGLPLDYYRKALTNASLMEAFGNSLTIAAACTVVSVILGAMAAFALWRFRYPGKAA